MKRPWNPRISSGLRSCVAAACGLACAGALAQTQPASSAPTYVDRVIEGGALPADEGLQLKATPYEASGWPRSWRVDYSAFAQRGVTDSRSRAVSLSVFLDTPNHGTWSASANYVEQWTQQLNGDRHDTGGTWRVDQRGLPLDGGWRANHSAGDISTGLAPLARGMGRMSLPTTPIRGLGGQWGLTDEIELNASSGRTGLFNGLDLAGFAPTSGRLATAGAQWHLPTDRSTGSRADAAVQLIEGRGLSDAGGSGSTQSSRGVWASLAWQGLAPWADTLMPGTGPVGEQLGGWRIQGHFVHSDATREGSANGSWIDALWRTERWRHTAGAFRFEPHLRWGGTSLASDLQGVYWQADTSSRQWQAGFATELSDNVSGQTALGAPQRSAYLNLHGRYSLDSRNAIGGALSLRTLNQPAQSLALHWDQRNAWGNTQWRSDIAHLSGQRTTRIGVDHGWLFTPPASLSTSLAWEHASGAGVTTGRTWIWGLLGASSPLPGLTLDAALRGARRQNGTNSLNAHLGGRWQWLNGWSLTARYAESRGQEPLAVLVSSALVTALTPAAPATQTSRSVQLLLRYEERAGTASAPLGGAPGTGAGSLSGTVFFDQDGNGRREATEGGVPEVTVILDRRFVTRTDAQGHYEFPAVAAGTHLLEVSADNVPLPWSPAQREAIPVTVLVRDHTRQDFAVQRDR